MARQDANQCVSRRLTLENAVTELRGHYRDARRLDIAHQGIGDIVDGVYFSQVLFDQYREVVFGRSENLTAALFMPTLKAVHFCIRHIIIVRRPW